MIPVIHVEKVTLYARDTILSRPSAFHGTMAACLALAVR
jgi:hypothetical protein